LELKKNLFKFSNEYLLFRKFTLLEKKVKLFKIVEIDYEFLKFRENSFVIGKLKIFLTTYSAVLRLL